MWCMPWQRSEPHTAYGGGENTHLMVTFVGFFVGDVSG